MEELPNILWSYRTTSLEGTGMIPFHLVYGGEVMVPAEIGMSSAQFSSYNEDNVEKRSLELIWWKNPGIKLQHSLGCINSECSRFTIGM